VGKNTIRVLHIDTERTWRGGQQQVLLLLKGLCGMGYHSELACPPGSALERACVRESLPCRPLRMRCEFAPLAGWRVAGRCRDAGYNIIHAHSAHALAVGLWAKAWRPDPALVAVRRVDFHIRRRWPARRKYDNRHVGAIVCVSDAIRRVLVEDGVSAWKLVTIRSGVEVSRFRRLPAPDAVRQSLGIPTHHLVVGTTAAIADYPTLLRAAEIVLRSRDDVTFCALGDGPEKASVVREACQLGLADRFVFAGFQEDTRPYLAMFDVFTLASRREGLGTAVIEAQAAGLPVVVTRIGGLPEIVEDGRNGLLVPPRDSVALAEAILSLLNDSQLRARLAHDASRDADRFSIETTVGEYIRLYERVSPQRGAAT
jgi:glycosyltransferase involved in cell wall biosynthesis